MHDWHSSETHFLRWGLRPQQVFKWESLYQKWQNFNFNKNITLKCGPLILKVFEYIFMGRYTKSKYRYHWNRLSLFNMLEFESDRMSLPENFHEILFWIQSFQGRKSSGVIWGWIFDYLSAFVCWLYQVKYENKAIFLFFVNKVSKCIWKWLAEE